MFYYYGRKKRLAGEYHIPEYKTVIEPFAGSAAYGISHLIKGNIDRLVLVEKDPQVVELWNRLLNMSIEEFLALPIPAVGEKTYDLLYKTTCNGNATMRCKYITVTPWMFKVIPQQRKSIAETLPYLKGKVEVIEGDYTTAPGIEACWFIDPPYQVREGDGTKGGGKGNGYGRGCSSGDLDFEKLGSWCKERSGQVIVCEQIGADWLEFENLKIHHSADGKPKMEVVWYNKE